MITAHEMPFQAMAFSNDISGVLIAKAGTPAGTLQRDSIRGGTGPGERPWVCLMYMYIIHV